MLSIRVLNLLMDIPSFEKNLKINEKCKLVFPIFGIHPWNAPEYVDGLEELYPAIKKSPMIGEIGLDHHFIDDTSQFDAVVCLTSAITEPLTDADALKTLSSMRGVLKDGGILVFDQGQTDAKMKNPSKFDLKLNERDYSRLFVMDYLGT
jgi:hypothetical protein